MSNQNKNRTPVPTMKLLSALGTNPKILKGDQDGEYITAILHLHPGLKVCPAATKGCLSSCLNRAGRGGIIKKGEKTNAILEARKRRTNLFFNEQENFLNLLRRDISKLIQYCEKKGVKPAVRLNGTSDLDWNHLGIIDEFPQVQFYDYTKRLEFTQYSKKQNFHVTISRTEETRENSIKFYTKHGHNVAVVFQGKNLPKTWLGIPVHDGDTTDLRFLDPKGVIVGLRAKGPARKDQSGFVVAI